MLPGRTVAYQYQFCLKNLLIERVLNVIVTSLFKNTSIRLQFDCAIFFSFNREEKNQEKMLGSSFTSYLLTHLRISADSCRSL